MKYILILFLFGCVKPVESVNPKGNRFVRVAAVDNDDFKMYTNIFRVKPGKVIVEFGIEYADNVREFVIESSSDGKNFSPVETLSAGKAYYRDTIIVE